MVVRSNSPVLGTADELDPALRSMPYWSLFLLFLKFGVLAWGGPMAQIDMLKSHFVDRLGWISKSKFNRVLAVYQALPGPEATELACYFGMMSRGRPGAVIAGLGFLLPGFLLMLLFSFLYVKFGITSPVVAKSLAAMQVCVAAMVIRAVHRISETALLDHDSNALSVPLLLLSIFAALQNVAGINFGITLLYGGLVYALLSESLKRLHNSAPSQEEGRREGDGDMGSTLEISVAMEDMGNADNSHVASPTPETHLTDSTRPSTSSPVGSASNFWDNASVGRWMCCSLDSSLPWFIATATVLCVGIGVVVILRATVGIGFLGVGNGPKGGMIGSNSLWGLFALGLLAGLLTFGGAYTAIPFVQQDAVLAGQWISAQTFLDGIAVTQIIPAPLVMFSTFVGYIGAGFPGALLMTLGMFLPAFSFTLIGHNFFEHIVKVHTIRAFLDGVTGSVMGLIAVTAAQLLKDTVISPTTAAMFGLCLAALYAFKSPWTSPLLVVSAAIMGQVSL